MASIFNLAVSSTGTVGLETWIDLGLIPTAQQIWLGAATFSAQGKAMTFEIRGNTSTKSAGTTAATTLLATKALKAGTSGTLDLYKNGSLIVRSIVGAGVEKWWLRIYSRSSTASAYNYTINYTNY